MSADRQVLSFAAVRLHGRAFLLMLTLAPGAQSPTGAASMPTELAGRIADVVKPATEIALALSTTDGDEGRALASREQLVRALGAHGITAIDAASGPVVVTVSCGSNLRERLCIAEVARADAGPAVVAVTRPHDAGSTADRGPQVSLEIAREFGQRAPVLDAMASGDRFFVLEPSAVTLYRRGAAGWQRAASRPVTSARPWPRDLRGRLRADDRALEAFLPGVTCRGDADLSVLSCAEDPRPWPLGIDNNGIDGSRNFFSTPEGLPFYAVAPLNPGDSTGLRWLIVDRFGGLTFLDASRQTVAGAGAGDDVVAVKSSCSDSTFVLVSTRPRGSDRDSLQLFRVAGRRLLPAAPPRDLPGRTTALWAAPGATVASVITHDLSADRYEAFQARVACDW